MQMSGKSGFPQSIVEGAPKHDFELYVRDVEFEPRSTLTNTIIHIRTVKLSKASQFIITTRLMCSFQVLKPLVLLKNILIYFLKTTDSDFDVFADFQFGENCFTVTYSSVAPLLNLLHGE